MIFETPCESNKCRSKEIRNEHALFYTIGILLILDILLQIVNAKFKDVKKSPIVIELISILTIKVNTVNGLSKPLA